MASVLDPAPLTEPTMAAAIRDGDEPAFGRIAERYRAEIQLHCYRMLGSLHDAEDLGQETFLRAWAKRDTFAGRSTVRAWLYAIASHACLDELRRRQRRILPSDVRAAAAAGAPPLPNTDLPWLEPYPDLLIDQAEQAAGPEAVVIGRETVGLAFLAAIQHLPPRQRAVIILRDVLDWSAKETAALLETTVAAVNSALQRAHATLDRHLPVRESDPPSALSEIERALLERLKDAWERADASALAALLGEQARLVMPPTPTWYEGKEAVAAFFAGYAFAAKAAERRRILLTRANRQPALAIYLPGGPGATHRPFLIAVLRIEAGRIAEITGFLMPGLFPSFGLPGTI